MSMFSPNTGFRRTLSLVQVSCVSYAGLAQNDASASIPAEQRCAHVNRLADRLSGDNALEHYERAESAYISIFALRADNNSEAHQNLIEHVNGNERRLAQADAWTPDERALLDRWLQRNAGSLDSLRKATECPRLYVPLPEGKARLSDAASKRWVGVFGRWATLMALQANSDAMERRWDDAYEWNMRIHQLADHAYQQPFYLQHFGGMRVESLGCRQLLHFLSRRPPKDLRALARLIAAHDETRSSDELCDTVEALRAEDSIELWYAWAADPSAYPNEEELARSFLVELKEVFEGIFGDLYPEHTLRDLPFKSPDEFRAALAGSTLRRERSVARRQTKLFGAWNRRPFHEAWQQRSNFIREYGQLGQEAPAASVFSCTPVAPPPGHYREQRERARMNRTALSTVLALHDYRREHGRLPEQLDALSPEHLSVVPRDVFSGRSLVYRRSRDGRDFILYSVGRNQRDDGGRAAPEHEDDGDIVYWPPDVLANE